MPPAASRLIYFDYNATTPLDPAVREVVTQAFDRAWGNPSSIHQPGRQARALLDEARERVATVLRCKPGEIVFTSGGTESNNLAILGAARARRDAGRHLICSSVEHPAVLQTAEYLARREGFSLTTLPVDSQGRVSPDDVRQALRPDTILVSVMAANNEIGTLQPVAEIGRLCRERGVLFHTDAVQWFGKLPVPEVAIFEADLVSICAHKFHGPKGAGVLYVRSPLTIEPILFGGSHEYERRAGTENLPAILGLVEALSRFVPVPAFPAESLLRWTRQLSAVLQGLEGVATCVDPIHRLSNTLAFTVAGADSLSLLASLDLCGVCASSGSACSVGSLEPSHVLLAMGVSRDLAGSLVRFSLGRENSDEEVRTVSELLPAIIRRVRSCR